jgi:hypothetical protein
MRREGKSKHNINYIGSAKFWALFYVYKMFNYEFEFNKCMQAQDVKWHFKPLPCGSGDFSYTTPMKRQI